MPPIVIVAAADADPRRRFLRKRIGRHDRLRRGDPLVGAERRARARQPLRESCPSCRATPMTPVDATSTCSAGQPTSAAVAAAISAASCSPSSPVQALAQPLLTTIARAMPPRPRQMLARDEDRRRLRAVGREHGGRGRRPIGDDQREVERAGLRLDAGTDARGAEPSGRGDAAGDRFRASELSARSCVSRRRSARRDRPMSANDSSGRTIAYCPQRRNCGTLHAVGEHLLRASTGAARSRSPSA